MILMGGSSDMSNLTVIRESGRADFYPNYPYFTLLGVIYNEYMTAGSNWDRPNMLLLDGKIVVPEGLADLAWDYGQRDRELHNEVREKLRDEFWPEWAE